jgi:hypothetical protein
MFDIDDTLIYTDGSPVPEMIKLYRFCAALGYNMVIITARPYSIDNAIWTRQQLARFDIVPDRLILTPAQNKTKVKKMLKFNFVLSVGDQYTDLGGSQYWIKLPAR